jgi:hypothetical protein
MGNKPTMNSIYLPPVGRGHHYQLKHDKQAWVNSFKSEIRESGINPNWFINVNNIREIDINYIIGRDKLENIIKELIDMGLVVAICIQSNVYICSRPLINQLHKFDYLLCSIHDSNYELFLEALGDENAKFNQLVKSKIYTALNPPPPYDDYQMQ